MKGEKISLLEASLESIPVYFLSLFVIQKSGEMSIEKTPNGFPLEELGNSSDSRLIDWKVVCKPKDLGRIRFRSIELVNSLAV